jgi:hypothetical protein
LFYSWWYWWYFFYRVMDRNYVGWCVFNIPILSCFVWCVVKEISCEHIIFFKSFSIWSCKLNISRLDWWAPWGVIFMIIQVGCTFCIMDSQIYLLARSLSKVNRGPEIGSIIEWLELFYPQNRGLSCNCRNSLTRSLDRCERQIATCDSWFSTINITVIRFKFPCLLVVDTDMVWNIE